MTYKKVVKSRNGSAKPQLEGRARRRGGRGHFACNWLLLIISQLMKGNSRQIIKYADNMPRPGQEQ